ncbi:MAG: hypothetical protein J6O49_13445 [Bacteroidaceae bacterium]|nr:hypothetical protein [Bacteroidaceae bacterium]
MLGLLGEIASLINGAIASGLKLVNNLVSSGFKMAFQFNESAMAFSRQAGLTAKQAQAYTEVLSTRAKDLGEKYGIAAEEVTKLEKNLARATGRVIMLSNAQADMQVAINRTVGEQTADQFSQTMMRTMGAQFKTVQGAVSKAYALAAKSGLDAAGMAAKVAQNLSMANRLTFRNGVDGLTKMVALSEKFGFNIQTVESAANSFMDLQDSIENAAKLTMLGGAAGALGGNPLDMTYEANADPEAFAERLTKMVAGYAQFDAETGMAKMNYMSRDMLKGMADAMHVSLDEMVTMAKKQAEITYKNNNFGADLERLSGGDEQKKDFLLNKTQINNGQMQMYSTKTGKYENMDYFEKGAGKVEFDEMMRFSNLSDQDIVREQAQAVVSIKERLEGYFTSIQGIFAEKIAPFIQPMQKFLGDIYRIVVPYFGQIADNVKTLIGTLFTPENLKLVKEGITDVVKGVATIAKWLTSNWKILIGAALVTPIISTITWAANLVAMFRGGGGGALPGGSGAGGAAGGGGWFSNFGTRWAQNRQLAGNGVGRSFWNSLYGRSGLNGNAPGFKGFGWGLGLGIGGTVMRGLANDDKIARGDGLHSTLNVAGHAAQYAGIGLGAASMLAPFLGPAAPIVMGIGALGGGIYGLIDGLNQNTEIQERRSKQVEAANAAYREDMNGNNSYVHGDRVYDNGINLPPVGANSVVKDEAWAVANRQMLPGHERAILELGESPMTRGQREEINSFVRAKEYDGATHIYVVKDNTGNAVTNNTQPTNSTITFNGTVRIEGGNTYKGYDINDLVNNKEFIRTLFSRPEVTDAIRNAMNTNYFMKANNDPSSMAGGRAAYLGGKLTNA